LLTLSQQVSRILRGIKHSQAQTAIAMSHHVIHGVRQFGARRALIILTLINLLNYADRYVPSSAKTLIEEDLQISDYQSSLPTTGDGSFLRPCSS
jgi:hypothetical protein